MNEQLIVGLVSFLAGLFALLFPSLFARKILEAQETMGFKFSDKDAKISKYVIVIVGLGFMIFGALSLLRIIHFN